MTSRFTTPLLRGRTSALLGLAFAVTAATTAHAGIIFTSNLSNITTPSPNPNGNQFQLGYDGGSVAGITNTNAADTKPGYNFIYQSAFKSWFNGASSDTGNTIQLDTAVMDDAADTQDGGYFLALDSVYENAAIDVNLATTAGDTYTVTFDWAGVQQRGYSGTTTEYLAVALNGSTAQVTSPVTVLEQQFSGWQTGVTDTFTATTTGNEVLSFLAGGTPTGANQEPAMTLLDNISVSEAPPTNIPPPPPPSPTPEPNSLLLLSTGLCGLGGFLRYRVKKSEGMGLSS
jgi:hypothetical protein